MLEGEANRGPESEYGQQVKSLKADLQRHTAALVHVPANNPLWLQYRAIIGVMRLKIADCSVYPQWSP